MLFCHRCANLNYILFLFVKIVVNHRESGWSIDKHVNEPFSVCEVEETRRHTCLALTSDSFDDVSLKTEFIRFLLLFEQFEHFWNLQTFSKLLFFTHLH